MRMKRVACTMLACLALVSCFCINAVAIDEKALADKTTEMVVARASGSFSMSISPYGSVKADMSFPLEAGETVRINASYSPDASLDFGLIDSDGMFHYVNVTDGNIDKTIRVDTSGNYTLGIQNNSSKTIKVSGFVRY